MNSIYANSVLESYPLTDSGVGVMADEKVEWITTAEAAVLLDMDLSSVSRLCRLKKINCRQHGSGHRSIWEVDKASAIAYRDSDKDVGGRPKKTEL
jgi:hypothetical protein